MSADKFDSNKPDLSLIPRIAEETLARVMQYGEKKYGRYNYTKGIEASRMVAAAKRHLSAWFDGEDLDKESGVSHLGHVMACCLIILRQEELGTLVDNRFKKEKEKSTEKKMLYIDEKRGVSLE